MWMMMNSPSNFIKYFQPSFPSLHLQHIGGLSTVPALSSSLALTGHSLSQIRETVKEHVMLTHNHAGVLQAADILVNILWAVAEEGIISENFHVVDMGRISIWN